MGSIDKTINGSPNTSHKPGHDIPIPPVTEILASFVADAPSHIAEYLTPQVRSRLKEYILDYIGVTLAATQSCDSTPAFLAAVKALGGHSSSSTGPDACTVLGVGKSYTPQYAGLLNAALGHSLDFDDTYAKGTLHAGVTAIAAAFAQAESLGTSSSPPRPPPPPSMDLVLVAIATGYEITCRLGAVLGPEAYARGFHNTSTAGIFGAVATLAVLKRLSPAVVSNAFGLAGSKAAGSMQYLANGSWNKRLHPGFAVHDAFVCVALAEAGVLGAAHILEGTMGFLHAYTSKPTVAAADLAWLTHDLGVRWEFLATSLKPFPACRMTHGFIEHAATLGVAAGRVRSAADVRRITLSLSPSNVLVVGVRSPNKLHPGNMVDAQFSAYFTTANSFLYGADDARGVQCYRPDRLADRDIWALSEKIVCVGDERITQFGSRIKVEYADGQVSEVDIPVPLGEVGRPFGRELVERKFRGLVEPVVGRERASAIVKAVDELERSTVGEVLGMLC
ncbi:MmgE/PrpD family protein [Cladophialophora carrionii]|uniref:MmgE/PrpD family protein n=1 Tax=Cladophialophora carrionii TaxID=86049 RepID=A0A1C1CZY0_9EURO|nr:MmgE/PrpD family protein [Cladophialophora carrionii]